MKWWKSFQWPPTCNRNFLIIFLYVGLSDLLQVVNTQSMFSWTPIVGADKKLINGRSETNINASKRSFNVQDERQYTEKIAPIPNQGSMPHKIKNDPFRFSANTKEIMNTKNYLNLDNPPNHSRSNRLKLYPSKHYTMGENNKLVSQLFSRYRNSKPSFENMLSRSSLYDSETRRMKKKHKNIVSPVPGKISSRSDRQNYLTWTNIEQPIQPQTSLSFNPFSTDRTKSKRIKKNVKLKTLGKKNIPVPLKDEIKTTRVIVTSSSVSLEEKKNETQISDTSRIPVMVMINSEILSDVKDIKNEDVKNTEEKNIKREINVPSETIKSVSIANSNGKNNTPDEISSSRKDENGIRDEASTKSNNSTEAIKSEKTNSNSSQGVTLRDECCPCLLENLDATTSILLQIYNEDRKRRNRAKSKNKNNPSSTKSKRSLPTIEKSVKKEKDKIKSGKKRKNRRKKRKRNKRQKGLFSQLDVCCLCNFLPEEDISLLSATSDDGNSSVKSDSSISTTTQRSEITTRKKFSHDISTIKFVQETTPSVDNAFIKVTEARKPITETNEIDMKTTETTTREVTTNENSFSIKITTENDDTTTTTIQPEVTTLDTPRSTHVFIPVKETTTEPERFSDAIKTTVSSDDVTNQRQRGGKTTSSRLTDVQTTNASFVDGSIKEDTSATTTEATRRRSNHPFIRYFRRLRKIYELDLKILDQIATLLEGINDELLPQVADALEPLLISQTVNMLDLGQILGYVAQTIHSSTFQLGASTSLGGLDFLKFGPLSINAESFFEERNLYWSVRSVIAEFSDGPLGFPIQKLILGKEEFDWFNSEKNADFVAYILTRKLTDYLQGTRAHVELNDGEVIFEADTPPLGIVDRCDSTIGLGASHMKGVVRRSSVLSAVGNTDANVQDPGSPLRTSITIGGEVDINIGLNSLIHTRFGKYFFSKCMTKFRYNSPVSMYTRGKARIAATISISDIRVQRLTPEEVPKRQNYHDDNHYPQGQKFFYTDFHFSKPLLPKHTSSEYINVHDYNYHNTSVHYKTPFKTRSHRLPRINQRRNLQRRTTFIQGIDNLGAKKTDKNGTLPYLVFKLNIDLDGNIDRFIVDRVGIDKCEVRILGLKVFSFCGIIKKVVKKQIEKSARSFNAFNTPRLLRRIEEMLRYRLGEEIYVPLLIADEKSNLLGSVIEKVDELAKLKGDLTSDLANLANSVVGETEARLPEIVDTITTGAKTISDLTNNFIETAGKGLSG